MIKYIPVTILLLGFLVGFSVTAADLEVLYKVNIAYSGASTQAIAPHFRIRNNGGATVAVSNLEVRYYFTKEGPSGTAEVCDTDYVAIGTANLVPVTVPGYLSLTFASGAGTLPPGTETGDIQLRLHKVDWSDYDQTNDYSFDAGLVTYTAHPKIALYHQGNLVFGVPGSVPTPTPEPTPEPTPVTDGNYDYADALEKAIWFFDANKCGPEAGEDNVFHWRDACHTEDSDNGIDLSGGYHDAGDHIKFGGPAAYSSSLMAWALLEYRSVFDNAGVTGKMLSTLKHFADYMLKSHPNPNTFFYQYSKKSEDHVYWGSPEVQHLSGESRTAMPPATPTNSASDITGSTAAVLALVSMLYEDIDPAYANRCLIAAQEIYAVALYDTTRSDDGAGGACYASSAHYDDLSWGGIWLYEATGNSGYLDPIFDWQNIPGDYGNYDDLDGDGYPDANWQFEWAANWDNITPLVMLKMAEITGEQMYIDAVSYNLNWFKDPNEVTRLPSGLPFLDTWACLRYASLEAGYGFMATKLLNETTYNSLGSFSIDYVLGGNPDQRSYLTGWGYNPPRHPHHRANEPGYYNGGDVWGLVGGLVGGPDQNEDYLDLTMEYTFTEVALDYNASFIFGLAGKIWLDSGGQGTTPVPATPTPAPTPTPVQATPTPLPTPAPVQATPTPAPTRTPVPATPTPAPTPTQDPGTSCAGVPIAIDFAYDGVGEFCWETADLGSVVCSWNAELVEINGVDFTNAWVSSANFPPKINGMYYIHYVSAVGWAHFEARH